MLLKQNINIFFQQIAFENVICKMYAILFKLQILILYVQFFVRENINIYLHFMSFLRTNKTQVVEIPPRVRQEPAYST